MMSEAVELPTSRGLAGKALVGFAGALGVAVATLCTAWVGGIVTRGELDQDLATVAMKADVESRHGELAKALDSIAEELKTDSIKRRADREMLVVEIRRRVGLQAEVSVSTDPKRKAAAQRAGAVVRARFDQLVLDGEDPTMAAEKALEATLLTQR